MIKRFCQKTAFSVAATQNFMFLRFINGATFNDLVVSAEYFVFGKFTVYHTCIYMAKMHGVKRKAYVAW